jgi:glycosyltransferase involved in cell wall biosynthesis
LNIGYYLKKKYGAKWVIDYRDPWTLGYPTLAYSIFADKFRKLIQRKDELKFLEHADQIITVSESLKDTFPKKHHHKISIIPNGANTDEMDLSKINPLPSAFSIVYAGTLYPQQLEHNYFFDVVKKFIVENNIKPEDFKLHFIGSDSSDELKSIIKHLDLNDFVNITKRLDLPELYSYMYNASMFLHLKYSNRDKIITSKQYDYLALQKAIILPQSDNGDIAESIIKNEAGYVCHSKEELYEVLQKEFMKFRNKQDVRIYRSESYVKNLSRDKASEELLKLVFSNVYLQDNINIDQIPPAILHGTI